MPAFEHRFEVSAARGPADLRGILTLQKQNLARSISLEEAAAQGFVTVSHELDVLLAMHVLAPSIVARAVEGGEERIVGYALAMPIQTRRLVPILEPMFEKLGSLSWRARPLTGVPYYVMGQVCVARNTRSLRAHERVGFELIDRYRDAVDEWAIVGWGWGAGPAHRDGS